MTEEAVSTELVPERIRELIPICHDYVRRAVGVEVDDTPETLPILDHYVRIARDSLDGRPELYPVVARALAAYFGELVRGTHGGRWYAPTDDAHEWRVCLSDVYLAISPLGIVYEAIREAADHDGPSAHLRVMREDEERIHERLAALPPVPEDEFFTFSTRFEVIEVAVESLLASSHEGGDHGECANHEECSHRSGGAEDVFFELEDYLDDIAAGRM